MLSVHERVVPRIESAGGRAISTMSAECWHQAGVVGQRIFSFNR